MAIDQPEPDSREGDPAPDKATRVDGQLMSDLSRVNYYLAQYLMRVYETDASLAEPIGITDELALAERFATAAEVLRARAARRWSAGEALKVSSPVDGEPV